MEKWKSDHELKGENQKEEERVDYINPLFNHTEKTKETKWSTHQTKKNKPIRATRSDKTHNIKFPVDAITQMKLKSLCKLANRIYLQHGKEPLKQTKFNTLLLQYGLNHKDLIRWDYEYKDTKVYMHTTLLETEYEGEIGGPHGLAIRKNLSERKVVYQIMMSLLKWIEGGGELEKII